MINKLILIILVCLFIMIYIYFNKFESFIDPATSINYTIKIDAIFPRPKENGETIIFRNDKWLIWSDKGHTTLMGPYGILNHSWFKKMPERFQKGLDTVIARPTDPDRELIMFKDSQWLLWSFANDIPLSGPHNIGSHPWFKDLPKDFHAKVDCVIEHPLNKTQGSHDLIFFSGSNWLIWNFDTNNIKEGPFTLGQEERLKDLPGLFKNSIDAGKLRGNNLLLFKANQWIIWDFLNKRLVSGPHEILEHAYFKKLGVHFIESKDDPTSQTYITLDKSGKGHHGVLHNVEHVANTPKSKGFSKNPYDSYKESKSIRFNGRTSYMEINNVKDLYKNGFSFSFYFMTSNFTKTPFGEMVLAQSKGDVEWEIKIQKNRHLAYRIKDKETGIWSVLHSDFKIKPEWYHVTITQSNTDQALHVNEIEIKKKNIIKNFPKIESSILVGVGGKSPNLNHYYDGVIGDIRIFNKALLRSEVCKLSQKCPDLEAIEKAKNEEIIQKNVEDLNQCEFIPKGLREIDCFRLCNSEKDLNSCNTDQCLEKCSTCKDESSCKWLVPPEIIEKPEQKVDPKKPDVCQFNPYGTNKTFCVNTCKGSEKVLWGGDACTEKKCELICGSCTNTDTCQWLEKPKTYTETPPDRPKIDGIAGDKEVILYWERPFDGNNPIERYTLLIYETNNTNNGINIDFPDDPKCSSCSHIVKNLKNNVDYSFGLSAINKIGMSKLSNIIVKTPYNKTPDTLETFEGDKTDATEKRLNPINKYKDKKQQVYSANGDMTDNLIKQLLGKTIQITI